jgi:antitoxin component HigA of HigAB toxin-antitoxin module
MRRTGLSPELSSLRDERDYAAAFDELDDLVLAEPGTPPGRRFDELVLLIEEYEARRSGYLLLTRGPRAATTSPSTVFTTQRDIAGANTADTTWADPLPTRA